jgi:hypothetical protein
MSWILINLVILIANLGVLGLMVKLYTEIVKDKQFDNRAKRYDHTGGLGPGK